MNTVLNPGDRVRVTDYKNGYERGTYKATVMCWLPSGKLRVRTDEKSKVKAINPDHVKKINPQ